MVGRARLLIPIAISATVMAVLFRQLDWMRLASGVGQITPLVTFEALVLSALFVLVKAFKWWRLLQASAPDATYGLALRSYLVGMTASLVTPSRIGELARAICFPSSRTRTLMCVLLDKLLDVWVLLVLSTASLWTYSIPLGVVGATCTILLAPGVWVWRRWSRHWDDRSNLNVLRASLIAPRIAANVGYGFVCYALMGLIFHTILDCLQPIPLWVASRALPLILLGSAMPIFLNGLGGREGIAVLLLLQDTVAEEHAVLASFLLFVGSTLVPSAVGLVPSSLMLTRSWKRRTAPVRA